MSYDLLGLLLPLSLLVGMLWFALLGHRYGRKRIQMVGMANAHQGTGVVEGAVFALLGLLVAFTFGTAYSRYNQRCDLVAEEVNAIGTAYLRVDLVGAQAQPALRQHFRDYVDSRIALWRKLADRTASEAELARTAKIQADIWAQAVKASEENQTARMLFLPALNEMFDIVTKRLTIMLAHPPALLYLMLFILAVMCGWLIGYGMSEADHPNWAHVVGYAGAAAFTLFIILDIEYPRHGLIRLDWAHELLAELRRSMN